MDDDAPPGVPEWVVTYGDMMSLLLTFFIMLVSLSEIKANKKYRAVLESLQQTLGYRAGPIAPPGDFFPLSAQIDKPPLLGSFSNEGKAHGGVKTPQTPRGEDLRVYLPRQGRVVPAGDIIDFAPFSIDPAPASAATIAAIAERLAGKPNKVEISGHTSSRPLPDESPFPDLLSLSYDRGRVVYDALVKLGIEPERLRIVALADHAPLPASHDAHELHEDRVEVQILDTYLKDYVGPQRRFQER